MEWMDWSKVRDQHGKRIPPEKRQEVLESVFKTLKTNGHIKYRPTSYAGKSIGNKLEQSRFLVYKDADAWLNMHESYGDGSIMDAMTAHIDKMSNQISLINTFGPNPSLMKDIIKDKILRQLAKVDATSDGKKLFTAIAEDKLRKFDDMFSVINRETSMPETNKFGMFMAGTRNILTSAYLGSASLLAIPGDLMTTRLTNKFNKLPAFKSLSRYMSMMNPLDDAEQAARYPLRVDCRDCFTDGTGNAACDRTGDAWPLYGQENIRRGDAPLAYGTTHPGSSLGLPDGGHGVHGRTCRQKF